MTAVYFRPELPGATYRDVMLFEGVDPPPTWKVLGRIDLFSEWAPLRQTAACRVVSADGQASVDSQITRELWETMESQFRGREWRP